MAVEGLWESKCKEPADDAGGERTSLHLASLMVRFFSFSKSFLPTSPLPTHGGFIADGCVQTPLSARKIVSAERNSEGLNLQTK